MRNLGAALSPSFSSSLVCPRFPRISLGEEGWPGEKGVKALPVCWLHSGCPRSPSPLHLLGSLPLPQPRSPSYNPHSSSSIWGLRRERLIIAPPPPTPPTRCI